MAKVQNAETCDYGRGLGQEGVRLRGLLVADIGPPPSSLGEVQGPKFNKNAPELERLVILSDVGGLSGGGMRT